jgi:DNA-directed RNA polymerase subunit K/omega
MILLQPLLLKRKKRRVPKKKELHQSTNKITLIKVWKDPKGPNFLTKYERAKIIGLRAKQLSDGAPPLINVPSDVTDPIKIAELELKANKIPILIKRISSNREYIIKLEEINK